MAQFPQTGILARSPGVPAFLTCQERCLCTPQGPQSIPYAPQSDFLKYELIFMTMLSGRCHCGNLQIMFETGFDHASLPLRMCQCSFCRMHGAVTATDPNGRAALVANSLQYVHRYRFGYGIMDFLVCSNCGVYSGALMQNDAALYASINVNVLDKRLQLRQQPRLVDYADETAVARRVRRSRNWTPATFAGSLP